MFCFFILDSNRRGRFLTQEKHQPAPVSLELEGLKLKGKRGHRHSNCFDSIIRNCSELLLFSFLCSERKIKPLLPRTDSYLVPIQLPVASSVYLSSSTAQFPPSCSQQKQNTSRGAKRVRIAPKVKTLSCIMAESKHTLLTLMFSPWKVR